MHARGRAGEYILALSTMFANTPTEKLRFAFEICDVDANGVISKPEFCELIHNMMSGEGFCQQQ